MVWSTSVRSLVMPLSMAVAVVLFGCGGASGDPADQSGDEGSAGAAGGKSDAWDNANAPGVFGVSSLRLDQLQKDTALKGYLPEKPWSDTYWPLEEKGLSNRWNGGGSFETFEAQRDDAVKALAGDGYESTWKLSPAEKYDILVGDASYGLTKEGWDVFAQYKDYEYDWSWMGHCHGWAPAAYLEKAPKAGVMATIAGKQVLFTEGDIRGLLTKVHATNGTAGGTRFLGTRCNARTIVRDDLGRIVDGTVYAAKADAPKQADTSTATTIYIDRNFWNQYHIITYRESLESQQIKVLQATAQAEKPSDAFVVDIYASVEDYSAGKREKQAVFVYNKACRDTNAGSFHLVLVQYLSDENAPDKKRGFVMDVTREDQVWNQPVYGFESKITSVANLADIQDPFAKFRAPGTVTIAQVESTVSYGVERGPYVDYTDANSSSISSKTYRYSLEIDANGYVIGGEWDRGSSAPDFLWAPQGAVVDSALMRYAPIAKVHECSLQVDRAHSLTLPGGQTIDVVDCEM